MHDYPIPNTLLVHLYQSPLKTRCSTSTSTIITVLALAGLALSLVLVQVVQY
jgi:hypothetical protein